MSTGLLRLRLLPSRLHSMSFMRLPRGGHFPRARQRHDVISWPLYPHRGDHDTLPLHVQSKAQRVDQTTPRRLTSSSTADSGDARCRSTSHSGLPQGPHVLRRIPRLVQSHRARFGAGGEEGAAVFAHERCVLALRPWDRSRNHPLVDIARTSRSRFCTALEQREIAVCGDVHGARYHPSDSILLPVLVLRQCGYRRRDVQT